MALVFKKVEERSAVENYYRVSLLSVASKIFENLQIIGLLFTSKTVASFLISSMVSGLLDQLQTF